MQHLSQYPLFIEDKLAEIKKSGGFKVCHDPRYTYILLGLGERRTGGYDIKVIEAVESQDDDASFIHIKAKEIKPGPDTIVTQVITYPTAVFRIPRTKKPIRVEWVRN